MTLLSRVVAVLVFLVSLVGSAASARADLTLAEKTSVQWLIWAANGNRTSDANTLHDTNSGILDQIVLNQTTASTREPLRRLKDLVRQAQINLDLAVADLLGAQMTPLGLPRSYYVDRAKSRVLTVRTITIPAILAAADTVKAAGAPGVYPWTIDRYKQAINGVLAKLNLFSPILAYADPYPLSRGKDEARITIIGPHGDYIKAMTWLATALNHVNTMYTASIAGYGAAADALLPGYWNKYQQMKFINLLLQKIGVAMGTINGMQFAGYSTEPFFRVLGITESLSHGGGGPVTPENDCKDQTTGRDTCHGASYDLKNVALFTYADSGQMATRPNHAAQQLAIFVKLSEVWEAIDTTLWYMLKFPECEATPGGCGGR